MTEQHIAIRSDHCILGLHEQNLIELASTNMALKALGDSLYDVAFGAVSLH